MGPRLEHNPREHHGFPGLGLDASRERHPPLRLEVVADRFPVLEGAVIPPNLPGLLRDAAVVLDVFLGERQNESVDVSHGNPPVLGGRVTRGVLPQSYQVCLGAYTYLSCFRTHSIPPASLRPFGVRSR